MVLVFQEKLDLQDKLTDVQAEYNAVYSEHEELKQKFEKERQCTGTVRLFFKGILEIIWVKSQTLLCNSLSLLMNCYCENSHLHVYINRKR